MKSVPGSVSIYLLRNEIANEYKSETIRRIFESVLELTPVLLDSVENIHRYATRYQMKHGFDD